MAQIIKNENTDIVVAIADWLSDPELIAWLQQKWQQSEPERIQNILGLVQQKLISDLSQNQIILVPIHQSIYLIGVDAKRLLLWTKQTERIGNVVWQTTPYWDKSAFHFQKS